MWSFSSLTLLMIFPLLLTASIADLSIPPISTSFFKKSKIIFFRIWSPFWALICPNWISAALAPNFSAWAVLAAASRIIFPVSLDIATSSPFSSNPIYLSPPVTSIQKSSSLSSFPVLSLYSSLIFSCNSCSFSNTFIFLISFLILNALFSTAFFSYLLGCFNV